MKSYFVIALLFATATFNVEESSAIQLSADLQFTDELEKELIKDEPKETLAEKKTEAKEETVKKTDEKKAEKKDEKKSDSKKDSNKKEKVDDDVPMDAAAIKAYSSVIADAAEDSEPEKPVVYGQIGETDLEKRSDHPPTM